MKRLAAVVVLSVATFTTQSRPDVNALATAALAQIDGEIAVAGLRAPVQVVRDTWGVPHITAQSVDDLFVAQGYVMAQDRLWQMDIWAGNEYFPLAFSRQAVDAAATHRLTLRP